jgi:hypothetical protein
MKFQVREGYVVRLVNRVEVSENTFQDQEVNYYATQVCDLTPAQADLHAHKLEPKDKAASDYLEGKITPVSAAVSTVPAIDVQAIVAAAVTAALAAQAATQAQPAGDAGKGAAK